MYNIVFTQDLVSSVSFIDIMKLVLNYRHNFLLHCKLLTLKSHREAIGYRAANHKIRKKIVIEHLRKKPEPGAPS